MQFLMLIRIENNTDYENSKPLPPGLDEAMGELMGDWSKTGALVSAAGLKPTSLASRVRLQGGKVMLTDGPFTESKEVIGGFFLVEAADRAAALEMTQQFVEVHRRVLGASFMLECELRQVDG
ncbi:MAG: transcriptional regulator [Polyangiaceae bacterium]|nr:transcriptional regulator [Polyangiaceae bacterium]